MKTIKIKSANYYGLIICLFWLMPLLVSAQSSENLTIRQKISLADNLVLSNGHERAYELYMECAEQGSARAINSVGIMLQKGWGTEKDEAGSIAWFEKAAEKGYDKALLNLARIYEKALGVEQDFVKAYGYYEKLVERGHKEYAFRMGYYHYKGLGVEQDYEKAVEHFLIAIERNNANAYCFLGLCYRNGYGVERNEGEAQYYLSKAADLGHYYSMEELAEEFPENSIMPQQVNSPSLTKSIASDSPKYRKIAKQKMKSDFAGTYTGKIITYDYSGKHVLKEKDLQLIFDNITPDGKVYGQWIEADTVRVNFEGNIKDNEIEFLNTAYAYTDRYNKENPVKWNFQEAVLEKVEADGNIYLNGNIQLYSPAAKEPEKPMYISLQKEFLAGTDENIKQKYETRFVTYPNPFDNELNVSFTLAEKDRVFIEVHSLTGRNIYTTDLGDLEEGRYDYVMPLNIPTGQYIISLHKKSGKQNTIVTKK